MKPARSLSTLANPWEAASFETPQHVPNKVSGFMTRPEPAMKTTHSSGPGSGATGPALDEDTAVMKLSPEFLEAVRAIAPRSRRSKIPYVFGLAILTVAAVLFRDRPTRDFLLQRWHQHRGTAPAVTMSASTATSPIAPPSTPPSAIAAPIIERTAAAPVATSHEVLPAPVPVKLDPRGGSHKVATPSRR
jgi:hypothetical protein